MRRHPTNRYPGVNAHLNSYLQRPNGSWSSFHAEFIPALRRSLDQTLPDNYYSMVERGIQLSLIDEDDSKEAKTRPDISIVELRPSQNPVKMDYSRPTASVPIEELEDFIAEEDILIRVGIYEADGETAQGNLVTTIEVLSAANKPHGSNYLHYLAKRSQQLQGGINLIELDFLHESQPIIKGIPSYPRRQANAYPYNILVTSPKPSYSKGKFDWFGVDIDQALPIIPIPLASNDLISFDLQDTYNKLFQDTRAFQHHVDYDTLPVNFNAYSEDDQKRIQAMLEEIRKD